MATFSAIALTRSSIELGPTVAPPKTLAPKEKVGANPQDRTDGFEQAEDYTERVQIQQASGVVVG
jgi:hypothetical protein